MSLYYAQAFADLLWWIVGAWIAGIVLLAIFSGWKNKP